MPIIQNRPWSARRSSGRPCRTLRDQHPVWITRARIRCMLDASSASTNQPFQVRAVRTHTQDMSACDTPSGRTGNKLQWHITSRPVYVATKGCKGEPEGPASRRTRGWRGRIAALFMRPVSANATARMRSSAALCQNSEAPLWTVKPSKDFGKRSGQKEACHWPRCTQTNTEQKHCGSEQNPEHRVELRSRLPGAAKRSPAPP